MEKQLTHREAWNDFYAWVRISENWEHIDKAGRNKIHSAQRDFRETRKNMEGRVIRLGYERIKNILTTYAPGRYTFTEIVTINEK